MEKKDEKSKMGGLFIPAGLMIGMGVGFMTGNFVAWMFVGLGVGFLGFALTTLIKK